MRIGLLIFAECLVLASPLPGRLCAAETSPGAKPVPASPSAPAGSTNRYEFRANHSPDGIGKFYMGREIAHVITGPGAATWLERPEREEEERTSILLEQLKIKAGSTVADIGAGTGYLSRRLAAKVGPPGRVLAEDIQPDMLKLLNESLTANAITNVRTVLGTITDSKLPAGSVDLAVLVDVYHEFDHPYEMMRSIVTALRWRGRIAFVEFRGEDPAVPIKELHKMTEAQVKLEMTPWPLRWVETIRVLPIQNIIVFEKAAEP